jgi:hypothetical protein
VAFKRISSTVSAQIIKILSIVEFAALYLVLFNVSCPECAGLTNSDILMLVLIIGFLTWGFSFLKSRGIDLSVSGLGSLGFGSVNPYALITVDPIASVEIAAIIANIPQIFLAIFTLDYQNTLRAIFVAREWNEFGSRGQMLRVSRPQGAQLGSWLLNLPFSFGIVIVSLNILLHWVISRSLFVLEVTINSENPAAGPPNSFSNCGFSPIAAIITVLLVILLLVILTAVAFQKFRSGGPPIVSTCSAAISASCHAGPKSYNLPSQRLRWGCGPVFPDNVGHCSLMADDQWRYTPVLGMYYR